MSHIRQKKTKALILTILGMWYINQCGGSHLSGCVVPQDGSSEFAVLYILTTYAIEARKQQISGPL